MRFSLRTLGYVLVGLGILAALVYAFLPSPVEADVAVVQYGPLVVTVEREGKTRVRESYVVSAPLTGRLPRLEWHPGDRVKAGETVLTVLEPVDPSLLDARARAEARARVGAAAEAVKRAEADLARARDELQRATRLLPSGGVAREEYEQRVYAERSARFAAQIAAYELELAQAALTRTRPPSPGEEESWSLVVRSPITGCVLEVFQENARVVPAGTELLRLGDTSDLEVVVDLLTTDAVKVRPGAKVFLEHWGGERPLLGRVRRVEPAGFTKVSALGVEEQRVNVLVDFAEPREHWQALGDGYRVEARVVIWEGDRVLKAPAGAVFRHDEGRAVFRVVGGRAALTPVTVGHSNGLETEILDGLAEGDVVVTHPSDRIRDGVRLRPRQE